MLPESNDRYGRRRRGRTAFRSFSKAVLLILFVFVVAGPGCPPDGIQQNYILAFVEHGSDRIRVRYSEDGQTWENGDFPNHTTWKGVGATTAAEGVLSVVFWSEFEVGPGFPPPMTSKTQALWGLGAATWDSEPGNTLSGENAYSAPSAAYAGESIYLVAFRSAGSKVSVRALDTGTRQWLSVNLAPAHTANSNVEGRPAIAVMGDTVLLAWHRSTALKIARGSFQIDMVGNEEVPVINWTDVYTFNLTEDDYLGPSLRSNPALTQDGTKFYLGVVRKSSTGGLEHESLFIYPSGDGITWQQPAIKMTLIPLYAYVSLAARSDGSLLAAVIGPKSPSHRVIKKYAGGSWTEIVDSHSSSADGVFGYVPAKDREFVLITNNP